MRFLKLILTLLLVETESARILVLVQTPSLSHHLFYRPIITQLAENHQVVSITTDPINDPNLENLVEISIQDAAYEAFDIGVMLAEHAKAKSRILYLNHMIPMILNLTEQTLSEPRVQLLKNQQFDLFLTEFLMVTASHGFAQHFNCPMVAMVSMEMLVSGYDAVGNPINPSYFIDWQLPSGNIHFVDRVYNFLYANAYRVFYRYIYAPKQQQLAEKYFGKNVDLLEIENNVDLLLVNTIPIFHRPKPLVPTIAPINGLNIREPTLLPEDIQDFLDEASDGVIYLSFGSNIRSNVFSGGFIETFLMACSKLEYSFVWKWEDENINAPPNVLVKSWLPQQDILRHPNILLFITQGGLQSIEEAIFYQVPLLGIPFGSDQKSNMARVAELGFGKRILLEDLTTTALIENITEIIFDERYQDAVVEVNNLIWDQPSQPLDRALWWIEYVLRHNGAKHLRSPTASIPFWIQMNLDIFIFLLFVIVLAVLVMYYSIVFVHFVVKQIKGKKVKLN